jgi:hypothetical protein
MAKKIFSDVCINYLEENPTFDVIFLNSNKFFIKNNNNTYIDSHTESDLSVVQHNDSPVDDVYAYACGDTDDDNDTIEAEADADAEADSNKNQSVSFNFIETFSNLHNDDISKEPDNEDFVNNNIIQDIVEDDVVEDEDVVEDDVLKEDVVEDDVLEEDVVEDDVLEEDVDCDIEKLIHIDDLNKYTFENRLIVWRKSIHNLIGNFDNKDNFWEKCIKNNLNIFEINI